MSFRLAQPRTAAIAALLLLGACSRPIGSFPAVTPIEAPAPIARGDRDSRYEACRAEATRIVQFRERGQLMRTDDAESGRGTLSATPSSRRDNDRGAAQIDRDRLIADCLRAAPDPVRTPTAGAR